MADRTFVYSKNKIGSLIDFGLIYNVNKIWLNGYSSCIESHPILLPWLCIKAIIFRRGERQSTIRINIVFFTVYEPN